jgi:predicted glycoside hydrolase/deacetylase ChbG (UPF0249 family)
MTTRRITLCADDYGISPGVNRGIRELIAMKRLNATSLMVVGPAVGRDEIEALHDAVAQNPTCQIGLHTTLTAPFHPLTLGFRPLHGGLFLPLPTMLKTSLLRRLDGEMIRAEILAQLSAFTTLVGRGPDYLDGHQHVQIFPQVRDALLDAVKAAAPQAWVRQCGRAGSFSQRIGAPKALLLDAMSAGFRKRATRAGARVNPAFAGAYDFMKKSDFAALMTSFFAGLPDGGLVMCHPGYVDNVLIALDPLTDQRQREYDYLASDAFAALLTSAHVALA